MKLFFAVVNPNFSPISSIQTVGSTPGKSTKNMSAQEKWIAECKTELLNRAARGPDS